MTTSESPPMTDTAELIARLKPVAWLHPTADWAHKSHGYVAAHCTRGGPRPLPLYQIDADALSSLVRERDEALKDLNRYAWERDKAREERDKTERRAEAFWKPQLHAAEADAARMREALQPFAKVGEAFSWAIGPDGIDDDLTVIIEPVARREWAQHLSTVNFTNASASLSNTSEGGKGAV